MNPYNDNNHIVKIITSHDEFKRLSVQWDDALRHYDLASMHISSCYIKAQWLADNQKLNPHIIMIWRDNDLVAMAALDKSIYKYRSLSLRAVIPLDQERYGRSDVILLCEKAAPILLRAVSKLNCDIWHLDRFPSQSLFLKYAQNNLPPRNFYSYEKNELAIINSVASWDDYLASKSKNFRRGYKRIMDAASSLRSEFYHTSDIDTAAILGDISAINSQSWKNDAGSDFSENPKRMQFFHTLLRDAAEKENLIISLFYDDIRPVAYTFGIIFGDILYAIETGYIGEYADRSAGIASYTEIMKYAHDAPQIKACDMDTIRLNGDYKRRWATQIEEQQSAFIIMGGFGGFIIRCSRILAKIRDFIARSNG